jgi:hypothetical protein
MNTSGKRPFLAVVSGQYAPVEWSCRDSNDSSDEGRNIGYDDGLNSIIKSRKKDAKRQGEGSD